MALGSIKDDVFMREVRNRILSEGYDPNTGTITSQLDPYTFETVITWIGEAITYIIAGNIHQAKQWICDNRLSSYIIVSSADQFQGTRNPHGIFIGDWYNRTDIEEIISAITSRSDASAWKSKVMDILTSKRKHI